MEFKVPYVRAMREQAPKMFNRLRRTGAMDAHLQQKTEEAHRMFEELTAEVPKLLIRVSMCSQVWLGGKGGSNGHDSTSQATG